MGCVHKIMLKYHPLTRGGVVEQRLLINTRYCGAKFGANLVYSVATGAGYSSPGVCDCSEPFSVRHGSDMFSDIGGDDGAGVVSINLAVASRGFCFDYLQLPCTA